jgi:hypothetical protein
MVFWSLHIESLKEILSRKTQLDSTLVKLHSLIKENLAYKILQQFNPKVKALFLKIALDKLIK